MTYHPPRAGPPSMAAAAGHWPMHSIVHAHLHIYYSPACNMQMQIILCWISKNAIRIIDSRGCGFLANYTHEYSSRTTANCGFINGPPTGGGRQTSLLDSAPVQYAIQVNELCSTQSQKWPPHWQFGSALQVLRTYHPQHDQLLAHSGKSALF